MTALELVTDSFRKLGIRSNSSAITTQEKTDAYAELNSLMRQYETQFALGYQPVSADADLITTPDWSHRWMFLLLAVVISPEYDKTPSQVVYADLDAAYSAVQDMVIDQPRVALPPDMPLGAGNFGVGQNRFGSQRFVGDQSSADILTGSGGGLLDETGSQVLSNDTGES